MREREREFLIIPSRICFGLGVGYFLTKGCCGFLSICERCLVRGGESFKELDFIWDVAFTFIGWVDKLWWSAPQWMTPCLSEKPMVCEAQCLMIFFFFFFFCCRLGLLSCLETTPQFYCFGVAISVDVKSVDSRRSPLWSYFHFLLGNLCTGTYNIFLGFLFVNTFYSPEKKFIGSALFFFVNCFYTMM
jgi:hypothetical protein